ncbi:C6 transcription factor [Purpureocillium lilacinum]|uniref:C6 transcription factor n=1 Tax=Purpureocillium lilacinum TaxID=33203 RepID=A0A179HBZ0_PURLI|nr:C6 transcription factor [Purpureocillium lilacinum]
MDSPDADSMGTPTPASSFDSPTRKRKHPGGTPQHVREFGLMRETAEHGAARFVGSSSGIHFVRAVYQRLAKRSASRTSLTDSNTNLIPGEDDQLRRGAIDGATTLWKDNEIQRKDLEGGARLSFDQLVEWSKSYFEFWHPALPFLHGPDILEIFERIESHGLACLDEVDKCVLKSVLSISLADSRHASHPIQAIPEDLVFNSVPDAVACSQFALNQPASVRATQAALGIQLFLTSMLCLNSASRLGGLIVRMAYHLGLHRCPTRYPFFTADEAALRRRVFWCMYCLERLLCQSLGLPLDIQDDDIDVCYPGEERHVTNNQRESEDQHLKMLKYLAKQARIRGLIVELRNKCLHSRQDTADRATAVQAELVKWSNEIQDVVEEAESDSDSGGNEDSNGTVAISPTHRLLLSLLKYESVLCLNRPMMASSPDSLAYQVAVQACISAARSICISIKKHQGTARHQPELSRQSTITALLWPSLTWVVWISAFVLLHAAVEDQVPLESKNRHVQSCKAALAWIAARETSWPEYCLEAIEELVSTVEDIMNPRSTDQSPLSLAGSTIRRPSETADRATRRLTLDRRRSSQRQRRGSQSDSQNDHRTPYADSAASPDMSRSEEQHNLAPPRSHGRGGTATAVNTFRQAAHSATASEAGFAPRGANAAASGDGRLSAELPDGRFATTQSTVVLDPSCSIPPAFPVEGQESMMWFDQLFASTFSAIDNPSLAFAEYDASIDPNWSYLR